jgi:hypothetical protein
MEGEADAGELTSGTERDPCTFYKGLVVRSDQGLQRPMAIKPRSTPVFREAGSRKTTYVPFSFGACHGVSLP